MSAKSVKGDFGGLSPRRAEPGKRELKIG